MEKNYKSEQELFWVGEFGDEYIERNSNRAGIAYRTALFSKVFSHTQGIQSALEFGSNIGYNLLAIRNLLPSCKLAAIEINGAAVQKLKAIPDIQIFENSILNLDSGELGAYDLTFTCGVLIHLNPDRLPDVYARLYECSRAYILVNEYYNPKPVEVSYRGHSERLFKRDFAGDLLDLYPDLELVNYGFQYHRDPNFPADDLTWFLLKKKALHRKDG